MRYRVELRAASALAISQSRATGNAIRTLEYVPGASLRGAVAAHIMREERLDESNAHLNREFQALFLSGEARFGDLRPAGAVPWPLSARTCAAYPEGHPILDLLLAEDQGIGLPTECGGTAAKCEAKLEPVRGFYRWVKGSPAASTPQSRINAHTAISNSSLRIRPAQFFSTEVLERGQSFRGTLVTRNGADAWVEKHLAQAPVFLTIGRGATRGQGHTTVHVSQDPGSDTDLPKRLREMNTKYAGTGRVAFTCTFFSPCLVYDEWLMSRPFVEAADIEEAAGEAGALSGYTLTTRYCRLTGIPGWNAQAKLPRPECQAIAPGSAFLFVKERVAEGERAAEIERLAAVLGKAGDGIGERWEEGFGEAVFCDRFHLTQGVKA